MKVFESRGRRNESWCIKIAMPFMEPSPFHHLILTKSLPLSGLINHLRKGMVCLLLAPFLLCLVQCGGVRKFVKLPGQRNVESPQPPARNPQHSLLGRGRDARALNGSSQLVNMADWGKMSKNQSWSSMFGKPQFYGNEKAVPSTPVSLPPRARNTPIFTRPDGQVQIYYRLEHFGGVNVTNSRKNFNDNTLVSVAPNTLDALVKVVQDHLGEAGSVAALPSENVLVITCAKEAQESVMKLMSHVDAGRKQVEIAVRIFEVSDDFDLQVGMNTLMKHLGTNSSQALLGNFSPASFAGRVVDPMNGIGPDPGGMLNLVGVLQDAGVSIDVTLEALERSGMVKVVSQPSMTVEAGKPAYMMAGQELPIREGNITNDRFVTEKISYKPVGVQLHITPQSIGEDSVKLHILTVVSSISGFTPLPSLKGNQVNAQLMNPVLDSRQAETRVEVPHGNTIAFGGLRMARQVGREEKIPFVGNVPGIGKLFKNKRKQKTMSDLYFFVTPTLVSR
ncbi:MAG: type II secretion system protein GspD [Akkermansiaceae bacterium]